MAFPWAAVGPALSGLSSLMGAGSSLFGSRGQSQADLMAMQLSTAQAMRRWELENGPSLEMAGLRAAGINPMLRYGSGGSGVPMGGFTPTVAAPFNRFQGFSDAIQGLGGDVSSAYQAMTAGERNVAETTRTEMETALKMPAEIAQIEANTSLTAQQRENAIVENARILQDTLLKTAQAELAAAQAAAVPAQIAVAMANVRLLSQQSNTEEMREQLVYWQSITANAESHIRGAEGNQARVIEELYATAYGQFMVWLREHARMAQDFTGVVGSMFGR